VEVFFLDGKVVRKRNYLGWADAYASGPPPEDPKDPVKPVVRAGFEKENFDKVDKGMTEEQLVALLGEPAARQKRPDFVPGREDVDLVWKKANWEIKVLLSGGKTIDKRNNRGWPSSFPSEPAAQDPAKVVTRDNYDRITKGLTEAEVLQLLGPPSDRFLGSPAVLGGDLKYTWRVSVERNMSVVLTDGKVVKRTNSLDWPEVFAGEVVADHPAVTIPNYHRLRKGMTIQEVCAGL